jgi:MoaA/NifB/PqqE/SkfB family radical SAM enzyme
MKINNKIEYTGHKLLETYNDYTRISWCMTEKCNYHCWYCYADYNARHNDYILKYEYIKNLFNNIKLNYGNRRYIKFVFTGGEPTTLGYKLFNCIEYAFDLSNVKELILHTNFSKNKKYFSQLAKLYSKYNIEINASLHLDYVNDNNIDDFIANIKAIKNEGMKIYVWVMLSDKNKDRAIIYRDKINKTFGYKIANYKYIQHPSTWNFINSNKMDVVDDKKNIVYKTNDGKKCYYNADELMIQQYNKYYGLMCMRGANQLSIVADGRICLADCLWKKKEFFLQAPGIYAKDVKLDTSKFTCLCHDAYCKHPSDNYIPKYSINDYIMLDKYWLN